jgi:hypothetical protein
MSRVQKSRDVFFPALKISAVAVGLALSASAQAGQFTFENGASGSFDTTISYGVSVRTKNPDASLIGIANGGTARSVNEDDGDRNYQKGKPFSNLFKVTSELQLKYENLGFFARGLYFTDFENKDRTGLGNDAKRLVGEDARMLDAFMSYNAHVMDHSLKLRFGKQVISWGESTFIPGGLNVINPVDLSKLRVPGSELKEGFIPTHSLWASLDLTKNASVEAYYLFNFDKTLLDPRGSYWSNNDFLSPDSTNVILSFGRRHDMSFGRAPGNPIPPTSPLYPSTIAAGLGPFQTDATVWLPRAADKMPSDRGQFGVAFRYLAPELNNTEFGFYFEKYNSRVPFTAGTRGTVTSALTAVPQLAALSGQTGTASYYVEYPEDIRLYGMSFNTQGPWGVALQGEYSYRPNQPLAYSAPEGLLAILGLPNQITGYTTIPGTVSTSLPFGASAAGLVPAGTVMHGWERVKMSQAQMTATKSWPSVLASDQAVLVSEVGYTKYHGLRSDIKFNGPANHLPVTPQGAIASSAGSMQTDGFITNTSWGYRLAGRLEYSDLILGANVAPRVAFSHDVSGVSQTFNEGVKSVSVGVNFDWKKKLQFDVSYTGFSGGRTFCGTDTVVDPVGQSALAAQIAGVPGFSAAQGASYCGSANPLKDRSFYSVVVSYSF